MPSELPSGQNGETQTDQQQARQEDAPVAEPIAQTP